MTIQTRLVLVLAALLAGLTARAQEPETYAVPDVEAQFAAIPFRPEAMGFHLGGSPDPTQCKHYQGIARSTGPGVPYLFVTKSGNVPNNVFCSGDDDPGFLLIVRMGSRDLTGERLRSNRLVRDKETDDSVPDERDTEVAFVRFDGADGWTHDGHPGGVQLVGDVLAIPLEVAYAPGAPDNLIQFVDVSTPEAPRPLTTFDPCESDPCEVEGFNAGMVGLVQRPNGLYLMLVTGGSDRTLRIFESYPTEWDGTSDLKSDYLDWYHVDDWTLEEDGPGLGPDHPWPNDNVYQMLNFVRQENGELYLIGARNTCQGNPLCGDDLFDLYRVEWEGSEFKLRWVSSRHVNAEATSSDTPAQNQANFAAASGVYISPSGELLIYTTEHDNDGPDDTVKFAEWRHKNIVREDSTSLNPTATAGGPYQVAEGGSVTLAGSGEGPITKAWAQMWTEDDFGDRSIIVDYDDRFADDFDDFEELDDALGNPFSRGMSDQISSWRWFAPEGCSIWMNDDDFDDDDFPGAHSLVLHGDGTVNEAADLSIVENEDGKDLNDELTSIQFRSGLVEELEDCSDYYGRPMSLLWDMDGDGVHETPGGSGRFSAAGLDGPSEVAVNLRAVHPTDGLFGTDDALIRVVNQPPVLTAFSLFDETGTPLASDGVVLEGLPVTLQLQFTDPGHPDTHTSLIGWADGSSDDHTTFESFADSTGGVTGTGRVSHAYRGAGSYGIDLDVTDDDGGSAKAALVLRVATASQVMEGVASGLDDLLAGSTLKPEAWLAVRDALEELEGQEMGTEDNGALDKLDSRDLNAALLKIRKAIEGLDRAEETQPGLGLGQQKTMLALSAKAVVVDQIRRAKNQATTAGDLERIAGAETLVAAGDGLREGGDTAGAVTSYQEALRPVRSLGARDEAVEAIAAAQATATSQEDLDRIDKAQTLVTRGDARYAAGNDRRAIVLYVEALFHVSSGGETG